MNLKSFVLPIAAAALCASSLGAQAPTTPVNTTITAIPGIKVGQFTLTERPTGCTVILAPNGTVGSVSQRGGSPGTRETDLLNPANNVQIVNAIVLSGGSAFGLDAASGAMKWLDERGIGYPVGASGVVPIVPAAILFDLGFGGSPKIRPGADCGYQAAGLATDAPVVEGNVGAGAGSTVGKSGGGRGPNGGPMKAGIGSAVIRLANGLIVGAIVAVNAVGDIIDPLTGQVVAGARGADGKLLDARKILRGGSGETGRAGENTTIGVVATNAKLTKVQAEKVAMMADDGYARAIFPSHTPGDGDTIFSLATGTWDGTANYGTIGALAAEAMAEAVVRAAVNAKASNGIPSARDIGTVPARFTIK